MVEKLLGWISSSYMCTGP